MLDAPTARKAKELLGELEERVRLLVFTQELECMFCSQNRQLAEEVAGLSDRISLDVFDFLQDGDAVKTYGIDKIPAIAVTGEEKDYGMRFYGIPSGYEFVSLIEAIKTVSTGNHGLSEDTVRRVSSLAKPAHIQVYVTPTCPYCPRAVVLAHRLAYVSDRVTSEMVEAMEFPHLANKYAVMGVPKSIINETVHVEGAVPEKNFVDRLVKAVGQ